MGFYSLKPLLSSFNSLVSGIITFLTVFFKIPVFLLRALGVVNPAEALQLAKQQDRTNRILLINMVLSVDHRSSGRQLDAEETLLLREEFEFLIREEVADLRASKAARAAKERRQYRRGDIWGRIWN